MPAEDAAPLPFERPLGARPTGEGQVGLRVWAPHAERASVRAHGADHPLEPVGLGTWEGLLDARPGDDYWIVLDGAPWPDPCSRCQPEGVRGPSRIVDPQSFEWSDAEWRGIDSADALIYELHVGAFTPQGTFAGVAERLGDLARLGVTAIELMPVATFPGARNWGYDGLYTWAPHHAYGGPDGLRRLVDAAHAHGLAVILDVVYNHVGPGNEALSAFGPYFSGRYRTPWGDAMNYDDRRCGAVREWAIQNACMWIDEYHLDGLRLDAVHAVYDTSPRPLLGELTDRVRRAGSPRTVLVYAESDANDPALVRGTAEHGLGFDGVWADDFHHALHALLTGERSGYYADYGRVEDLAAAFRTPFTYAGGYSAFRERRQGAPVEDPRPSAYVVCAQNHDQIGNRALGDRLPEDAARLGALCALMSPWTPLLFMGEEYGETRPFLFFTDHIDPKIARATREGRRREHSHELAPKLIPDPQDPDTFRRSALASPDPDPSGERLVAELIRLRRGIGHAPVSATAADEDLGTLVVRRGEVEICASFAAEPREIGVDGHELLVDTGGAELADGTLRLPARAGAVVR